MKTLQQILDDSRNSRERDKQRWDELDEDLCMVCHAYGQDKRSVTISCLYEMKEIAQEFIDLFLCTTDDRTPMRDRGYYMRICKSCRGNLLGKIQEWVKERSALRHIPKDHDGYIADEDETNFIPVRVNGMTVMMNEYQYEQFKSKQ